MYNNTIRYLFLLRIKNDRHDRRRKIGLKMKIFTLFGIQWHLIEYMNILNFVPWKVLVSFKWSSCFWSLVLELHAEGYNKETSFLSSYDDKGRCQRISLTNNYDVPRQDKTFNSFKNELLSWAESKGWKVKKMGKTIEIERSITKTWYTILIFGPPLWQNVNKLV